LARRVDACGDGAFLRKMAEGYLALAGRCISRPASRTPRIGRGATGRHALSVRKLPVSRTKNNASPN